jgi:hypothetical protein
MTSIFKISILAILSSALLMTSCKKNALGGEAAIHARIFNSGNPVMGPNTVYVKFKTSTQPNNPTTNYDLKVEGEAGENHVHIEDLRPGDYFLYAVGFDSTDMRPVHGGVATSIMWSERKEMIDAVIEAKAD